MPGEQRQPKKSFNFPDSFYGSFWWERESKSGLAGNKYSDKKMGLKAVRWSPPTSCHVARQFTLSIKGQNVNSHYIPHVGPLRNVNVLSQ